MKITFLAAIVLSASVAVAQSQHALTTPIFTARGAFLAIVVTDLDASEHWYESRLGLHLVKRGKSSHVAAETAVLGGDNFFVELIYHQGKQLPRLHNEASVPRLIKGGVIVPRKDFDAVAAYLRKCGTEAEVFKDKEMGVLSFLFKDNEGNLIQFFTQDQ